ncbi:hypothetical protein THASP1DRAFT_32456 [Thamnocephalis sphaerospora]|uniref:Ras guanine nucleotide exchange factor domain-containing protein n=1 Tax=Thamnocephalis sphaerospora TaxID=78915 RepID=A0A4P9XJY6_9FUNG|nr:hypothetical protein THASP1DRAFT_32456 [Thamnocephalis sphaerospora]|eukprot:RKP05701.1 hypothetical protein THASP1DRAFT_32456 [Thamnocephalis sphaerospora]
MTRLMVVVLARHDYTPTEEGCIPLRRGDILLVMNRDNSGWWDGICYESRQRGWFPSEYVMTAPQEVVDRVIQEQVVDESDQSSSSAKPIGATGEHNDLEHQTGQSSAAADPLATTAVDNAGDEKDGSLADVAAAALALMSVDTTTPDVLTEAAISASSEQQPLSPQSVSEAGSLDGVLSRPPLSLPKTRGALTGNGSTALTIDTAIAASSDGQPRTAPVSMNGAGSQAPSVPAVSLQLLIDNILQPIAEIRKMQQLNSESSIGFTNNVVRAVRNLLYHTGVKGEDAPALQQHPELRQVRQNLFVALKRLVAICKLVTHGSTPPADTLANMHTHALGVLEYVKKFILLATELQLELITEPSAVSSTGIARTRSATDTGPRRTAEDHNMLGVSSTLGAPAIAATPTTPFPMMGESRGILPPVSSPTNNEAEELYEKLGLSAGSIRSVIEKLLAFIEAGHRDSSTLQVLVQETVNTVGQLFSLIDDIHTLSADWARGADEYNALLQFSDHSERLFADTKSMRAVGISLDLSAASGSVNYLITCITRVRSTLDDVVGIGMHLLSCQAQTLVLQPSPYQQPAPSPMTPPLSGSAHAQASPTGSPTGIHGVTRGLRGRKGSEPSFRTPPISSVSADSPLANSGSLGRAHPHGALGRLTGGRERFGSVAADPFALHSPPGAISTRRATDAFVRPSGNSGSSTKMAKMLGVDTQRVPSTGHAGLQAQKPKFLMYDYEEGDIRANMENQISGGTWAALVERLAPHDTTKDEDYMNVFLLSFRSFATPEKLADQLYERFRTKPPKGLSSEELEMWRWKKQKTTRIRVINTAKIWLGKYFFHGKDEAALPRLRELARLYKKASPSDGNSLLELIEKKASISELQSSLIRPNLVLTDWRTRLPPAGIRRQRYHAMGSRKHRRRRIFQNTFWLC